MNARACLKSMRLRTLPLSESGVLLGMFIAIGRGQVGFLTAFFLIITTALLQILSNLSNELGDTLHGTDTAARQGIHYSIMDGEMTVSEMKKLIAVIAVLCCLSGLAMIFFSFGGGAILTSATSFGDLVCRLWNNFFALEPIALVVLGAAAILAAMGYTLGRHPYGYKGLGDIFVFIFFGLVSVCGGYYVCSHDLTNYLVLLPAAGIGCFSVGVLNVNNIRDMKTDSATRKTVALAMGATPARIYQTALVALGWALLITYTALTADCWCRWLFLLALPLYVLHLRGIWTRQDRALDPMLPLLVMSTFVLSLLMGIPIAF